MKIRSKWLAVFCVSAVATTAVWPSAAMAFERRVNAASLCSPYGGTGTTTWSRYDSGLWNNGTSGTWAACGLPNDSNLSLASVIQVNVHGYDNSTTASVGVEACATYWGSNGSRCGPMVYNSGNPGFTGDYLITLTGASLSAWTGHSTDFGLIDVYVANGSSVRGIYFTN